MFDRIISIDWSGAGTEGQGVDLRVATHDFATHSSRIVDRPHTGRAVASWSREIFRSWVIEQLQEQSPTLIALDFGFGLPWGADRELFGVNGWRDMLRAIGEVYRRRQTARSAAQEINANPAFGGHGPYRFNDSRNDFRFYMDHGVSYYRLTELLAPQAISQWYLGSGGTVGFHTISGLSMLDQLISLRESNKINFSVWPHEVWTPDCGQHLFVESYPALCPHLDDYGPCRANDGNQKDAWKVLQYLVSARMENRLPDLFSIPETPFGRLIDVAFRQQVQFEGFILGLR